jgi:hypothetical protein
MLALGGCAPAALPLEPGPGEACDPAEALEAVRAATEAYADVDLALDDGYVPQDGCDEDERGAAMGVHYVRIAASLDQDLELEAPDVLLYLGAGRGAPPAGLRLVGVEYVRPALVDGAVVLEPPVADDPFDPPPELFCRPFDGPMAGHVDGQPWHYDLHVWLYADNPDGMFAAYNPAERCP